MMSLSLVSAALAQAPMDVSVPTIASDVIPPGQMITGDARTLVLQRTEVHAHVEAGIAQVDVAQTFHNPFDTPIDATYLFPLPVDAAVRHMELRCGSHTLIADIRRRTEARRLYEQAKHKGKRAALLEQQRDNLFTYEVSALCPGEDVVVELQYLQQVPVRSGHHVFTFPTTVSPRYAPGDLTIPDQAAPTRDGRDLELEVTIEEGMPLESLFSDSHDVTVLEEDEQHARIQITEGDRIPNKDFELRWSLAGHQPRAAALTSPGAPGEDDYLALTLAPQLLQDIEIQRHRELLFVMDSSCSMQGDPWTTAVDAVLLALEEMGPHDTFNLVRFSDTAGSLFDRPQPATSTHIEEARAWVERFEGGGTEMSAGIVHSLDMPGDPDAMRLVLLMTDGFIGDERTIFETTEAHLGDARVFALGVGPSVNRLLLEGLARQGRGTVSYQLPGTPLQETVEAFYAQIAHPAMTDVTIDYGALDVREQFPARIPDLWAGQLLRVSARFRGGGSHPITVSGLVDGEPHSLTLPLELHPQAHEGVEALWARRKILDLSYDLDADPAQSAEQITALGLRHHLVTDHTSLVVVDAEPNPCDPVQLARARAAQRAEARRRESQGLQDVLQGASDQDEWFGAFPPITSSSARPAGPAPGAGTPNGPIAAGLGGLGTHGLGSGASGYGSGSGSFSAKGSGGISQVAGVPIILGALDRSAIEEVIQRDLNAIRYCYQRQLQRQQDLSGEIVIRFTIAGDGTVAVASVKDSSMGSEVVERCVVERFRRMTFSAPAGGEQIVVTYPLSFSPG